MRTSVLTAFLTPAPPAAAAGREAKQMELLQTGGDLWPALTDQSHSLLTAQTSSSAAGWVPRGEAIGNIYCSLLLRN